MTHYGSGSVNEMVTFGEGVPALSNDVYLFTGDVSNGTWSLWVPPTLTLGVPAPRCCMVWS